MSKIVATIKRSDGNDTVGEMWNETAVFESDASINDVMQWASDTISSLSSNHPSWDESRFKKSVNVTMTLAQEV